MKQNYIDLKMPSIMGMGAVGPTLSVLTASLYSALVVILEKPPLWAYPALMFVLSCFLAVFPTAKSNYKMMLKIMLWPIVSVIIFSAAWGTNHGLSLGEDTINKQVSKWEMPSFVSSAYAQDPDIAVSSTNDVSKTTNKVSSISIDLSHSKTNEIDFSMIDLKDKVKFHYDGLNELPRHVWGLELEHLVLLKDKNGKWQAYRKKKNVKPSPELKVAPQMIQQKLHGGFFKRWK